MNLTSVSPTNPLVYNPVTLPFVPLAGALFGNKKDPHNVAGKLAAYSGSNLPDYSGSYVLQAPTGENPIATLPGYGGAGGSLQAATYYAARDFVKMFGRNPTASELTNLAQHYLSDDPNITNSTQGQAALSQYYQQLSNSPENTTLRYQSLAPKHYDTVKQIVQGELGRDPTQSEMDHFGGLIASGVDPYQLSQYLQATPEYQTAQDSKFREGLKTDLQKTTDFNFSRAKEDIISRYAQMGRSTSPALDAALTELSAQLGAQQDAYLAQVSTQQYGQNKDLAVSNYKDTLDQYLSNQSYTRQQRDQMIQREQDLSDYNREMMTYNDMMANYSKSPSIGGRLIGGLVGTGIGLASGQGAAGAKAGYQIGSGLGGSFDYLNS